MPELFPADILTALLEALRTHRNARRAAKVTGVNPATAWRIARKHGIALISLAEHMKARRGDPAFIAKQAPAARKGASRWLKAQHAKPKFHKKAAEAARRNLTRLNRDPAFRQASSERLKRLRGDPGFRAKQAAAARAARDRAKHKLNEKAIEGSFRDLMHLNRDAAFRQALGERLKRLHGGSDFHGRRAAAAHAARDRGFAIAPILYLLGLIGVGAGVLFSGYSQILRSNQTMANIMSSKNDLQGTATTLAASSWLSTDQTLLCPPMVGSHSPSTPSTKCSSATGATTVGTSFGSAVATNLPANYASVSSAGSPVEVGVFAAGSGAKVLDPWGHYYIYCRWENAIGTANAIMIISGGPNGKIESTCGSTTAGGDDLFVVWTTAVTQNRAAVWQTTTSGTSVTGTQFGATGSQIYIDTNGDVSIPGTLGVTGATTLGTAGLTVNGGGTFNDGLTASTGVFTGEISGASLNITGTSTLNGLSAGTSTLSVLSVTNNATVGGTLGVTGDTTLSGALTAGTSTLSSLSVAGTSYLGGNVDSSTGLLQIGTSAVATGSSSPLLTVGKPTSNVYPFYVDQYGAVTGSTFTGGTFNGNLVGSQSGGSVSATTLAASGAAMLSSTLGVAGQTTLSAQLNGTSAIFSGNVQAASFTGTMSIGGGGVTLSGVVPIANGGTGQTSASAALAALGVTSGGYLNTALLTSNLIPGADLTSNSVTSTQLNATGVAAGTYTAVTVGVDGRVTAGSGTGGMVSSINDGSGDTVTVGTTGGIVFAVGSSTVGDWTSTGLMVGTSAAALDKLDVYGATAIGTGYAGVTAAPTNGLIVQGNVGIGTNNPLGYALNVNGGINATSFTGSGAGLTGIGTSSISGTVGTGDGGTGTNTVFTQGSVVFAGASGVYSQDNANFFWNDTNHTLGLGTSTMSSSNALEVNGAASIGFPGSYGGSAGGLIVKGNVGIGSTAPMSPLQVSGGNITVDNGKGLISVAGAFIETGSGGGTWTIQPANSSSDNILYANDYSGLTRFFINAAGNIGIGTTSPANLLDVNGAASIGYNVAAPTGGLIVSGAVGIGTNNPLSYALDVNGNTNVNGTLTATNFSGGGSSLTGVTVSASNITGVVPIANGGTNAASQTTNGVNYFNGTSITGGTGFVFNGSNVGIGTATPDNILSLGGQAAETIDVVREYTGSTPGNNLTLKAGGAVAGGTNLNGGNLTLSSGISTGTGSSSISFQTYDAGSSGTSDNSATTALNLSGTGTASAGTAATVLQAANATGLGTNINGGSLTIASGVSTGTGSSNIAFNVYGAGSSGTSSNSATTTMTVTLTGLGIGTATPLNALEIGGGLLGTFIGSRISVSNASANSGIDVGQASGYHGHVNWVYNSTAANSYLSIGVAGGTNPLILQDAGGSVGVGTASPQSKLHIQAGEVQTGTSGNACATANAGAIRYASGVLYFCDNASTWETLDSSGAASATSGDWEEVTQAAPNPTGTSQGYFGASATLGGILSGQGSTADVTLENKSGSPVLEIPTGSTNLYALGNLGIGTATPQAALAVYGTDSFLFGSNYTTTGTQSDVAINTASSVRYTGASAATFNGIVAGTNGQIVYLHNGSTATLTLANMSGSESTVTNQIVTGTGNNLAVAANSAVILQYDASATNSSGPSGTLGAWRVIGGSGGTPAGSNTQVQYNNNGAFAGNSNFSFNSSTVELTVGTGQAAPIGTSGTIAGVTVNFIPQASTNTGSGIAGGVTVNSATTGEMAYYSGASAISGTSDLYVSGSNIGIGTATASQPLVVNGNIDAMGSYNGYITEIPNSSTPTVANKLAKMYGANTVTIGTTGDTDGMIGVVVGNAGTSGAAQIAIGGQAGCVFDGAPSAVGDFVTISSTTAGDCHDTGSKSRGGITSQIIGQVVNTVAITGSTYPIAVNLNGASSLPSLASTDIWIGNASNVPTAVAMTGDCTIASSGAITCTKTSGNTLMSGSYFNTALFPALTGDVISTAGGVVTTVAKIQGVTVSGTTGAGNVVFSASPTLTGTITGAGANFSGNVGIGTATLSQPLTVNGNIDVYGSGNALLTEIANAGTTGTAANKLAKLTGAPSTAIKTATTDTGGAVGIVVGNAGTTGTAQVAVAGQANCVFDSTATVAGDYVQISSATAGDCTDAGSTYPTSGQVLGRVLSTNGSGGGTYAVALFSPGVQAASGGGSLTWPLAGPADSVSGPDYSWSGHTGTGLFYNNGIGFTVGGGNVATMTSTGIGIGTAAPDQSLSLNGQTAQTIDMVREYTASTPGNNLTLQAGGAVPVGTNLNGGNLILSGGISTGTGSSNIQFQTYPAAASTSTSDNAALTALTVTAAGLNGSTAATTLQGNAGSGSNQNGGALTLASGVSTGTGSSSINFQVYGAGVGGSNANPATTAMTIASTGNVGIGTASPAAVLDLSQNTGAAVLPVGSTGQRPSTLVNGMQRYNSTTATMEAYVGSNWIPLQSIQSPVTNVVTSGASCSNIGQLATDSSHNLVVCVSTVIAGQSCSAEGAGALTFDTTGGMYVCLQ